MQAYIDSICKRAPPTTVVEVRPTRSAQLLQSHQAQRRRQHGRHSPERQVNARWRSPSVRQREAVSEWPARSIPAWASRPQLRPRPVSHRQPPSALLLQRDVHQRTSSSPVGGESPWYPIFSATSPSSSLTSPSRSNAAVSTACCSDRRLYLHPLEGQDDKVLARAAGVVLPPPPQDSDEGFPPRPSASDAKAPPPSPQTARVGWVPWAPLRKPASPHRQLSPPKVAPEPYVATPSPSSTSSSAFQMGEGDAIGCETLQVARADVRTASHAVPEVASSAEHAPLASLLSSGCFGSGPVAAMRRRAERYQYASACTTPLGSAPQTCAGDKVFSPSAVTHPQRCSSSQPRPGVERRCRRFESCTLRDLQEGLYTRLQRRLASLVVNAECDASLEDETSATPLADVTATWGLWQSTRRVLYQLKEDRASVGGVATTGYGGKGVAAASARGVSRHKKDKLSSLSSRDDDIGPVLRQLLAERAAARAYLYTSTSGAARLHNSDDDDDDDDDDEAFLFLGERQPCEQKA